MQSALDDWPLDADCALLDLGLPDAVGLTALEKLRAQVPDVPVVVLTGRIDDGIGPEALAAGAQDFLVKGQVDGPGLERSVRYAVERGRATVYQRDLVAAELHAQENARLQRGLLPSPLIDTDDLRVALFYRPGSERALLGGDFYDVVQTPTGVHVLIGDVSGHGPDEAALGVALRIAWRALVLAGLPAAAVLQGVEQVLLAERERRLALRHGGHGLHDARTCPRRSAALRPPGAAPDPRRRGPRARGRSGLPMLTMVRDWAVEPATSNSTGDWGLLLFTDGLVEGRASPGATERFGVDQLTRNLRALLGAGDHVAPTWRRRCSPRRNAATADP